MNTFWLKIAAFTVFIVAGLLVSVSFLEDKTKEIVEDQQNPKKFSDVVKEDQERFAIESVPETVKTPQIDEAAAEEQKLYFEELDEIEDFEAARLYEVATKDRSIGRLPGPGFNLMVESCRKIIRKWPRSKYAYNAKRLLADIPENQRRRYDITEEETDLSVFEQPLH